ncbi:recombinase family protein [Undibacterium sp. Ji83W]|uniref:recombinase family protein n=1 Tax=Undibacterium sp. Ji83W TaxID=3413043 RepID=UPI003BEFD64D
MYQDLTSVRKDGGRGLNTCLKALEPGKTLVAWKPYPLGRDLRYLLTTAEELRARNISLKVLAGAGAQIDTTTANWRLFFGIFAELAEFERELIAERTHAGIASARAQGCQSGGPWKID